MNTEIKIEKGIKIPTQKGKSGAVSKMREMKVGDSFALTNKNRGGLYVCAQLAGIQITSRKISETEIRVWRTA